MIQVRQRNGPNPTIFHVEKFGGINLKTKIEDNESPDSLNCQLSREGLLERRPGYKAIFKFSLGDTPIQGMYIFNDMLYVVHGGRLYEFDKEVLNNVKNE
jgi:hypothetical protein